MATLRRLTLAEAVGVNPQTIGFLERRDYGPTLELALRICEHFGLPVEAVFSLREFAPMSTQLYPSTPHPILAMLACLLLGHTVLRRATGGLTESPENDLDERELVERRNAASPATRSCWDASARSWS